MDKSLPKIEDFRSTNGQVELRELFTVATFNALSPSEKQSVMNNLGLVMRVDAEDSVPAVTDTITRAFDVLGTVEYFANGHTRRMPEEKDYNNAVRVLRNVLGVN